MVATSDLKILLEDSEELRIMKEENIKNVKKNNYYIGFNLGTYGAGIGAGIIF